MVIHGDTADRAIFFVIGWTIGSSRKSRQRTTDYEVVQFRRVEKIRGLRPGPVLLIDCLEM